MSDSVIIISDVAGIVEILCSLCVYLMGVYKDVYIYIYI